MIANYVNACKIKEARVLLIVTHIGGEEHTYSPSQQIEICPGCSGFDNLSKGDFAAQFVKKLRAYWLK